MLFEILNNKFDLKNFAVALSAGAMVVGFTTTALPTLAADEPLKTGEKAPDFTLLDEEGHKCSLSDFKGKPVVVFFYDENDEPVTKKEAKSIQAVYKKFKLKDCDVLGIGENPAESHKAMKTNLELEYHLLTDKNGEVKKMYHLGAEQHGRYGVVVDKHGIIRKISGGNEGISEKTVADTLDMVNSLPGGGI